MRFSVAVTMDDVAARAGVSRAAVSFALRNSPKVSASQRAHIAQVAAELGYRPNVNASRLASSSTGTIGVVFSDLHNLLYADALDGFAGALADSAEQMLLASGFHDPTRERAAVEKGWTAATPPAPQIAAMPAVAAAAKAEAVPVPTAKAEPAPRKQKRVAAHKQPRPDGDRRNYAWSRNGGGNDFFGGGSPMFGRF